MIKFDIIDITRSSEYVHIPESSHMTVYGNTAQLKWQLNEVHVSNAVVEELGSAG